MTTISVPSAQPGKYFTKFYVFNKTLFKREVRYSSIIHWEVANANIVVVEVGGSHMHHWPFDYRNMRGMVATFKVSCVRHVYTYKRASTSTFVLKTEFPFPLSIYTMCEHIKESRNISANSTCCPGTALSIAYPVSTQQTNKLFVVRSVNNRGKYSEIHGHWTKSCSLMGWTYARFAHSVMLLLLQLVGRDNP